MSAEGFTGPDRHIDFFQEQLGERETLPVVRDWETTNYLDIAGGWAARISNRPDDEQLVRLASDRSVVVRHNVITRYHVPSAALTLLRSDPGFCFEASGLFGQQGRADKLGSTLNREPSKEPDEDYRSCTKSG